MTKHTKPKEKKILVVEDNSNFRETLLNWLSEEFNSYAVFSAVTGEEAVAMAGRIRPNLILMDIRLPGITGIEAMKEIFRRGIETEVVVITNHDEEICRDDAMNAGARNFIPKRSMWNSLPEIIESHLT